MLWLYLILTALGASLVAAGSYVCGFAAGERSILDQLGFVLHGAGAPACRDVDEVASELDAIDADPARLAAFRLRVRALLAWGGL